MEIFLITSKIANLLYLFIPLNGLDCDMYVPTYVCTSAETTANKYLAFDATVQHSGSVEGCLLLS